MKRFTTAVLLLISTAAFAADKPNIIFIMADDHTFQAIGAYGSRLAKLDPTPNIDALAKNGMRFDRVFCNNSICTPSRASIITGQYSQTNGVLDLGGNIPPERQFLPIEMKKAGYQTAMVGKWHLKQEPGAFDYYCVLPGQGKYFNPQFRIRGDKPWPKNTIKKDGMHSSDAIADICLKWLKNGRKKDKPFFLMFHFKAPHDMFQNAKRYDAYLKDVEIPEPENLFTPPAGSKGSAGLGSGVGRTHAPWRLAKKLKIPENLDDKAYAKAGYQAYLKRYLRCVKGVDDNVGRLIAYLKEEKLLDNTVIMYTGDQGFMLGEHDYIDKRWMYEESMRMPFFVRYPRSVKAGTRSDLLINNTDFAPTMLELAGVDVPDYMQGRSFARTLAGKREKSWRKETYYRYWMHMAHRHANPAHFGIRTKRYKLIFYYGRDVVEGGRKGWGTRSEWNTPPAWELYDLKHDPKEMNNVYADPKYTSVVKDLKTKLERVREELNETDEQYPHIQKVIDAHWDD